MFLNSDEVISIQRPAKVSWQMGGVPCSLKAGGAGLPWPRLCWGQKGRVHECVGVGRWLGREQEIETRGWARRAAREKRSSQTAVDFKKKCLSASLTSSPLCGLFVAAVKSLGNEPNRIL